MSTNTFFTLTPSFIAVLIKLIAVSCDIEFKLYFVLVKY